MNVPIKLAFQTYPGFFAFVCESECVCRRQREGLPVCPWSFVAAVSQTSGAVECELNSDF